MWLAVSLRISTALIVAFASLIDSVSLFNWSLDGRFFVSSFLPSSSLSFVSFPSTRMPFSVASTVNLYDSAAAFTSARDFSQSGFPFSSTSLSNAAFAFLQFVNLTFLSLSASFTSSSFCVTFSISGSLFIRAFCAFSQFL